MIFRMQVNISGDRAPPETRPADNRTVYYHGRAISGRCSTVSKQRCQ
ncbi:TPA: hypothetical protein RG728_003312 [Morganella morganii subsp. morganii]|nr:hypothetical protein [Morganella morganii]EKW8487360.1 hypothetical protein [Morganella morganii]HAT3625214.1 hypothetical protein [Morganella morganii]HDU8694159.1 hypothetical protein [Morganella morganii subsp. morganii]